MKEKMLKMLRALEALSRTNGDLTCRVSCLPEGKERTRLIHRVVALLKAEAKLHNEFLDMLKQYENEPWMSELEKAVMKMMKN